MKIKMFEISVRDIVNGFEDSEEYGVVGFNGQLNIRPAYQREFIYKDKQRDEVIRTIQKGFPLNVMYWVVTNNNEEIDIYSPDFDIHNSNNHFELLDGQQRTISICQYVKGEFSIDFRYFHNLTNSEQNQILDYRLMIYVCYGSDKEKLDWFKIINIAGEELSEQELRNAIYTGEWLTSAKKYFSKTNCPAYQIGQDYLTGRTIRQEYLEKTLKWISESEGIELEEYMSKHQHDANASILWAYYQNVINWVKTTFPNYRSVMKGIEWGELYNSYHNNVYDTDELERKIIELLEDEDVTSHKGIYQYLFDGKDRHLNIRTFSKQQKQRAYTKQNGVCPKCKKVFEFSQMEGDHITPWHLGGHTTDDNLQMLCKECNRIKSGI